MEDETEQTTTEETTPEAADQSPGPKEGQAPKGDTVNRHKHEREVAKLEKERDDARAEAEGYKGLKAEFDAYKAEQAFDYQPECHCSKTFLRSIHRLKLFPSAVFRNSTIRAPPPFARS
ncbi:hypothetical protein [Adlercreutzia shanghongiae]|uniref:Nucleotide exchange factor GrpE n=1 Tax=Adlercreutzia shanghongiae TaxID=3111773 RepID=A0ABU6IWN4_9ACTN|nr:hypothetical protein [Adlercreutzia sp. R22]MEC4294091.1 hypothetical protein [Adlercreutzia sp. R22]